MQSFLSCSVQHDRAVCCSAAVRAGLISVTLSGVEEERHSGEGKRDDEELESVPQRLACATAGPDEHCQDEHCQDYGDDGNFEAHLRRTLKSIARRSQGFVSRRLRPSRGAAGRELSLSMLSSTVAAGAGGCPRSSIAEAGQSRR